MIFADRIEAAELLAQALEPYRDQRPLILAIPRGAVPMGAVLARRLRGDFDLVMVRKLRAPRSPEFAVGAIDETGWAYVAPHALAVGASHAYLQEEQRGQLLEMRRRRALYTPGQTPVDAAGRTVIVVDDGLATGATMIAALHAVRERKPARLVCAIPVAAPDSLEAVRPYADEIVCLHAPAGFGAVGQFYRSFPQVEDDEVVALLSQRCARPLSTGASP
ncbi:MAG: phosphoribosyltransferase family protein [Pseudomonadota bacterium]